MLIALMFSNEIRSRPITFFDVFQFCGVRMVSDSCILKLRLKIKMFVRVVLLR